MTQHATYSRNIVNALTSHAVPSSDTSDAATTSSPIDSSRIIKKRAADAGVEGFISGHSLRVESAVSLAQAGATVVDMQVARMMQAFYNKFCAAMKFLGLSQQDFIVRALEAEFGRVDLRKQCQVLTNANAALSEKKERLLKERNAFREGLKVIAKSLGVPDTASHCVQRIAEIKQALETATEKLSVVEGDRDMMQSQRDEYKGSRDCFKAKYEDAQSDLVVVKAKLRAYQGQGFWGRVLGRVPVVVPFAEPVE